MADNRKEQERAELHRTIWSIANDLRGSVDGWDFKQYVLGMLFYRANNTLFIDASKEFVKVTNSNKLTEKNLEKILSAYINRGNEDYYTRLASNEEIEAQDYNLSVSTYVEQEDTREVIDIKKLNAEIEEIVAREAVLRDEIAAIIAEIEGGAKE